MWKVTVRSFASLSPFYRARLSFNWRRVEHLSITFTEEVIKVDISSRQAASGEQGVPSRLLFWRQRRQSWAGRQNKSTGSLFSFVWSFYLTDSDWATDISWPRPLPWPREPSRSRIRDEPKTLLHKLCECFMRTDLRSDFMDWSCHIWLKLDFCFWVSSHHALLFSWLSLKADFCSSLLSDLLLLLPIFHFPPILSSLVSPTFLLFIISTFMQFFFPSFVCCFALSLLYFIPSFLSSFPPLSFFPLSFCLSFFLLSPFFCFILSSIPSSLPLSLSSVPWSFLSSLRH